MGSSKYEPSTTHLVVNTPLRHLLALSLDCLPWPLTPLLSTILVTISALIQLSAVPHCWSVALTIPLFLPSNENPNDQPPRACLNSSLKTPALFLANGADSRRS